MLLARSALAICSALASVATTDANCVASISYRVETAENTTIADASVDLTTVGQALHWFDLPAFAAEVRRVSAPDAVLSAWSYAILKSTPAVDAVIETLYNGILGSYWTPERKLVEEGYASVSLPFEELTTPSFAMHADWTLAELLGYLSTWSAGKRYEEEHGSVALNLVRDKLADAWGDADSSKTISWPLTVRTWRVE